MIPFRSDRLINNNVEYRPASNKHFAMDYYGIIYEDNDNESEKSYEATSGTEGFFKSFVFLSFNAMWSLIAATTTTYIYTLISYREFFSGTVIIDHPLVMLVYFASCGINLIDIVSSTMHSFSSECRDMKVYTRKNFVLIIIDVLSIVATVIDIMLYIVWPGIGMWTKTVLVFVILREYRMFQYFRTVTRSPLWQGRMHVLIKYCLLSFVLNHTAACFWKLIACFNCNDGSGHWNEQFDPETLPSLLYVLCMFNALDATTTMGLVGGSARNNSELMLTLILMIYNMLINMGVFLGAFTELQIESNWRAELYRTKLRLIWEEFENENISNRLRKSINTWYVKFWVKENGVMNCPLVYTLPDGFRRDIMFDKYFSALNKCHHLRHLHHEVKIALSLKMYTMLYNHGDVILHQNKTQQGMIYLAKGVVQMVSPDDMESPIIQFEYGTSIGGTSMLNAAPIPSHLVAATYCHIYKLDTDDFWRTLADCYKLKPTPPIFEANKFLIKNARQKQRELHRSRRGKRVDKTLKLVKDILKKNQRCEITGRLTENNLLGIYQISKGNTVNMDQTFKTSTFPWILYENSSLRIIWQCVVFFIAAVVVILYPYFLFFLATPPPLYYQFLRPVAYAAFAIDVVIQLCTSTSDKHQRLIFTFSEIMSYQFGRLLFVIDVLSITPFEVIGILSGGDIMEHMSFLECNHMLKIVRVVKEIVQFTHNFYMSKKFLRIVFYIICLLYFGYVQGILYYKIACPKRPCPAGSWVRIQLDSTDEYKKVHEWIDYELLITVYDGIMLLTGTGGVPISNSIAERAILLHFCITYMFFFTYLLADYSAILTLDRYLENRFRIEVSNLTSFLSVANVDRNILLRMNIYMETIYDLSGGRVLPLLFEDIPPVFKRKLDVEKTMRFVERIPLFKKFSRTTLHRLLAKVKYETYPANEYVACAGDQNYNMYVIQKGYCEITPIELHIKTWIGPYSHVGVYEMILKLPLFHSIKTVTNVQLLYLNVNDFQEIFNTDLELKHKIQPVIDETLAILAVTRYITVPPKEVQKDTMVIELETSSFISFKGGKLDATTIDLNEGWEGYSLLSFCMLKKTIRPDSNFIYSYVLFHAMIAFMSAILYPSLFILECIIPWYAVLLLSIPWDILCLIDVYLRLHVCYYNANGLLVSHPRCTAAYYLKHSFAVDFLTALPLKLLFDSVLSKTVSTLIVLLVKVIRAYRIPNGFNYFRRDILKNPPTYILILYYLTMSLVFWNTMSLGLVLISVEFGVDKNGLPEIQPLNGSWFYTKVNSEITFDYGEYVPPLKLYLLASYCVTCFSLKITLADVIMIRPIELIYIIVTIISGYIWFTYILVIIANTKGVYDDNLSVYKNNLKDLCSFMNKQNIPRRVKNRNIRHYEYIYQRNQGYRNSGLFDEFHPTLKKDCQWQFYASTLLNVPIFKDMDMAFYQKLCAEITIVYYLEDNNILCVNDVINWVYIICRGSVCVYSATKSPLCVLTQGAIFGNLDNVKYSRCPLKYTTITTTDILCIPTTQFYNILQEYPAIMNALKSELFGNNFFYLESEVEFTTTHIKEQPLSRMDKFLMSTWIKFIFMIKSYLSYQLALYHVAFQDHSTALYTFSYFLDFCHIVKIYFLFRTPYVNDVGEVIKSSDLIRKRLVKTPTLYIDFFALIPLEIFSLACSQETLSINTYISIFRLNRAIRFLNINWYMKVTHDFLSLNMIIIKMISLFINWSTYIHLWACVWNITACPNGECIPGSWIYDKVTNQSNCKWSYLCAVYYVMSLVSTAGFSPFVPRKILEIIFCAITVVLSKFVTTMLVANMAGIVRHFGYRLQHFAESVHELKEFFNNGRVSPQLQHNVLTYVEQLWLQSCGKQMPEFMDTGPTLLIEEMKIFAFGMHIFSNPVFRDCHNDFLRLLTTHAKLVQHFMGDVICNQAEINDTMYFIHGGQVEVLSIADKLEVQVDLLTQLDCFGMIQGLFPNTPHSHTYKAMGNVHIVTLKLTDWMQILAFYPAAKFHIYKIIRDHKTLTATVHQRVQ